MPSDAAGPTHLSASIEVAPAFHDLDPMWVVWHGHYWRYLELARCALLEGLGYGYEAMRDSGFAWPVVDARLKYVRALRYGERASIRATIVEWEHRLKIEYLVTDAATGARVAKGHTVQVAVSIPTGELQYVCPPVLWERLGVDPR
jgi:acyl-CoA thioester hydrolase